MGGKGRPLQGPHIETEMSETLNRGHRINGRMEGRGSLMKCVTQTKVFGRELLSTHSGHLRCAVWLGVVLSPFISHWRQPLLVYENIQGPSILQVTWSMESLHVSWLNCYQMPCVQKTWIGNMHGLVRPEDTSELLLLDSWESVAHCAEWPFPRSVLDSSLKLEGGAPIAVRWKLTWS